MKYKVGDHVNVISDNMMINVVPSLPLHGQQIEISKFGIITEIDTNVRMYKVLHEGGSVRWWINVQIEYNKAYYRNLKLNELL